MEGNLVVENTEEQAEASAEAPRPVGISVLIGWYTLVLFLGAVSVPFAISKGSSDLDNLQEAFSMLGYSAGMVLAGLLFVLFLTLGSLAGMILGTRWGWHFCTFYYMYRIASSFSALLQVPLMVELEKADTGGITHSAGFYIFKFGVRIFISLLLYLYFYKSHVRAYFGIEEQRAGRYALYHLAMVVVIFILCATGVL